MNFIFFGVDAVCCRFGAGAVLDTVELGFPPEKFGFACGITHFVVMYTNEPQLDVNFKQKYRIFATAVVFSRAENLNLRGPLGPFHGKFFCGICLGHFTQFHGQIFGLFCQGHFFHLHGHFFLICHGF